MKTTELSIGDKVKDINTGREFLIKIIYPDDSFLAKELKHGHSAKFNKPYIRRHIRKLA